MRYTISGDDATGYKLVSTDGRIITSCPCCHKPIPTRRIAEIISSKLILAEEEYLGPESDLQ